LTAAVRGRILYDFSGNACEGYALQFRQVSELNSGEGKVAISDLRATSWEEGEAKRLRVDGSPVDSLGPVDRRPPVPRARIPVAAGIHVSPRPRPCRAGPVGAGPYRVAPVEI
jgi:hypothetical protein